MGLKVLGASNGGTWADVISSITYAANAGMNIVSLSIQVRKKKSLVKIISYSNT